MEQSFEEDSDYSSSSEFSSSKDDDNDVPGLIDWDNSILSDDGVHFDTDTTDENDEMDVTMPVCIIY